MPVNFVALDKGGEEGNAFPVDTQDFRAMAQRCRDLLRIAVRSEVKEQLLEWIEDFEAEAEAVEGRRSHRSAEVERAEG